MRIISLVAVIVLGVFGVSSVITGPPAYADELTAVSPLDNALPAPTTGVEETPPSETAGSNSSPADTGNLWSSPLSAVGSETTISTNTSAGRSFYVSTTGSNSADGSQTNPWQSIQYGVSQLRAGDTLYIEGGAYQESVVFSSSGISTAYITIQGVGSVVIDGSNFSTPVPAFNTNGNSYIRFNNLTVNHTLTGIEITPRSSFIEIDGFNTDGNKYAVRIDGGSNVNVRNTFAVNSNNAFRAFGGSHDLVFENIKTYNSKDVFPGMDPNYLNGDGFILESDVSHVTLRNIVSGNNWDAGFDVKASDVLIENAEAYGNKNNFKLWGTNITIKSSLSHHAKRQLRSNGTTVEGNGITVEAGSTTKLINVTLVDNEDHDIRIYGKGTLNIENGIVARRGTGGMLFENDGTFTSNRVLWHRAVEDFSNLTLSLTDFWADPGFVDWNAGNYRLKETSLAVNYGSIDALSPYDLDLNPRLVGPRSDLGAYEFQSVPSPKFSGISNGDLVSKRIYVEPDRNTFPTLQQMTYYLDGNKVYTTKNSPFTWGGSKGFDTTTLSDGTHILTGIFQITSKLKKQYSIAFTVDNTSPRPLQLQASWFQPTTTNRCRKDPNSLECRSR